MPPCNHHLPYTAGVGVANGWWNASYDRKDWSKVAVGQSVNDTAPGAAWVAAHGAPYAGVSWWAAPVSSLPNATHLFLKDAAHTAQLRAWLGGHALGGCNGTDCTDGPIEIALGAAAGGAGGGDDRVMVLAINASAGGGLLRRIFAR